MARKFLYVIAFLVVLFVAGRLALQFYPEALSRTAFTPTAAFEPQPVVPANAYADPALWIARPDRDDGGPVRWTPTGLEEDGDAIAVPVFFIHPTTYLKKTHWNAPIADAEARRLTGLVAKLIASPFNRGGAVWMPRYRQATLGAFLTDGPEGRQALDLAYGDVATAFDAFVATLPPGKPFAIAGHSQGGYHLKRLLADKIKDTPLRSRMVAAYPIGWPVDQVVDLPAMGFPACSTPDQTGCVISWLAFSDEADPGTMIRAYERVTPRPAGAAPPSYLCSNPLTGGIAGSAPASANPGTLVPTALFDNGTLKPGLAGARCAADGSLRIGAAVPMGALVLPDGNYHVYDIPLFWRALRDDFTRRARAWRPA
jgi:hypothetical protein